MAGYHGRREKLGLEMGEGTVIAVDTEGWGRWDFFLFFESNYSASGNRAPYCTLLSWDCRCRANGGRQ